MKPNKIKRKMILAFLLKRRKSMILTFENNFWGRFRVFVIQMIFCKNIHFHTVWNKNRTDSKIQIFLFRDIENLKKYLDAEKLSWDGSWREKTILMGRALGYPKFAIDDFIKMRGDSDVCRVSFRNFYFGYDGFVFSAKNISKVFNWAEEQGISKKGSLFCIFENGENRILTDEEISKMIRKNK